ncbi:MAG: shikimate kinase [Candidatus Tyrphobacter sp.]
MKHVALVGFMAAGKSTVGRLLAQRIGWPFVDTDALIEKLHGPIAAIFADEGESAFREYELEAVAEAARREEPSVIAVGGGAVTHPSTRALLMERTFRVFLAAREREIARRLRGGPPRPILGFEPSVEIVAARYRERLPLYRESELVVDCTQMRAPAVARRVEELLRRNGFLK